MRDLWDSLRSRRLLIVSIILGIIFVLITALLTLNIPEPVDGEDDEGVPSPLEVWHKGGEGVLTGVAFSFFPILLPFLPATMVNSNIAGARTGGVYELSHSKPVYPWAIYLGKGLGIMGAVAVPTIALSLATVLTIQIVAESALDSGLVTGFVLVNLFIVGLYLLLTLTLTTIFSRGNVGVLTALLWLAFNIISPLAFLTFGRLATFLGGADAVVFTISGPELASFTGLYHGLLSGFVPQGLGFAIPPDPADSLAAFAATALPWVSAAWIVALAIVTALLLRRVPSR